MECPKAHSLSDSLHIPKDAGIVSGLFQANCHLLGACLSEDEGLEFTGVAKQSLIRIHQALFIWGDRHDVSQGALDVKLQSSQQLLTIVVKLLSSLARSVYSDFLTPSSRKPYRRVVLQLLEQSNTIEQADDESEDESCDEDELSDPDSDHESLSQHFDHLDTAIQCLNDLNGPLAEATFTTTAPEQAFIPHFLSLGDVSPYQYFARCIRERFPTASTSIVEHLGKANLARYRELHDLRTKVDGNHEPIDIAARDAASKLGASEFQDSGYGSAARSASYAKSIAHSTASSIFSTTSQSKGSRYPSLSQQAKTGDPFECAGCAKQIVARNTRDYRKHLLRDLCPYTCFIEACAYASTPFTSRKLWSDHLLSHHPGLDIWSSFTCPLCLKAFANQRTAVLSDIAKHLEEISLSALPQDVEDDASDSDQATKSSASELLGEEKKAAASQPDDPNATLKDLEGNDWFQVTPFSRTNNIFSSSTANGALDATEEDGSTIRCFCGYSDDDGNTVLCEICNTWQHIECYYPNVNVPEVHECVDCVPRPFDAKAAAERQRKARFPPAPRKGRNNWRLPHLSDMTGRMGSQQSPMPLPTQPVGQNAPMQPDAQQRPQGAPQIVDPASKINQPGMQGQQMNPNHLPSAKLDIAKGNPQRQIPGDLLKLIPMELHQAYSELPEDVFNEEIERFRAVLALKAQTRTMQQNELSMDALDATRDMPNLQSIPVTMDGITRRRTHQGGAQDKTNHESPSPYIALDQLSHYPEDLPNSPQDTNVGIQQPPTPMAGRPQGHPRRQKPQPVKMMDRVWTTAAASYKKTPDRGQMPYTSSFGVPSPQGVPKYPGETKVVELSMPPNAQRIKKKNRSRAASPTSHTMTVPSPRGEKGSSPVGSPSPSTKGR